MRPWQVFAVSAGAMALASIAALALASRRAGAPAVTAAKTGLGPDAGPSPAPGNPCADVAWKADQVDLSKPAHFTQDGYPQSSQAKACVRLLADRWDRAVPAERDLLWFDQVHQGKLLGAAPSPLWTGDKDGLRRWSNAFAVALNDQFFVAYAGGGGTEVTGLLPPKAITHLSPSDKWNEAKDFLQVNTDEEAYAKLAQQLQRVETVRWPADFAPQVMEARSIADAEVQKNPFRRALEIAG